MKYLSILLILLITINLSAQDYTASLEGVAKVVIKTETSVVLKAYKKKNLLLKASENEGNKLPQKAKGLKSMTTTGADNTNFGAEVKKVGNLLMITGLRSRLGADLILHLPKGINISVEVVHNNDIYVEGFSSEIEAINKTGDITLENVTGPIVAESDNGDVSIIYSTLSQASPTSIVVANGEIDIKMPADAAVNISSKTPRGDFYTDFDFTLTTKRDAKDYSRRIAGKINGGGVTMDLQNLKGNIYLRGGHYFKAYKKA